MLKKRTSTANEFPFHKCKNSRKIEKCEKKKIPHLYNFTSLARELPLHKCRNNKKMRIYIYIYSYIFIQVQLMSFSYILDAIAILEKSKEKM